MEDEKCGRRRSKIVAHDTNKSRLLAYGQAFKRVKRVLGVDFATVWLWLPPLRLGKQAGSGSQRCNAAERIRVWMGKGAGWITFSLNGSGGHSNTNVRESEIALKNAFRTSTTESRTRRSDTSALSRRQNSGSPYEQAAFSSRVGAGQFTVLCRA